MSTPKIQLDDELMEHSRHTAQARAISGISACSAPGIAAISRSCPSRDFE
jgi:hypothetical protein